MGGEPITLAAGQDFRSGLVDAMKQISNWLTANQGISVALRIIGGALIALLVVCLVLKNVKPSSPMVNVVNSNMTGIVCGALLGAVCVAPGVILPLFGQIFGYIMQFVFNILNFIFK